MKRGALRVAHDFVVNDCRLELEQKVLVLRIVFRHFGIVSCKAFDGFQTAPIRHRNEVSNLALLALENVDTDVALYRSIVWNSPPREKFTIRLSLRCWHAPMPQPHDHQRLLRRPGVMLPDFLRITVPIG